MCVWCCADQHDKLATEMSKTNDGKEQEKKKETPRKPVTPEIFGPALFSTPDIIRKINTDEPSTSPNDDDGKQNAITGKSEWGEFSEIFSC